MMAKVVTRTKEHGLWKCFDFLDAFCLWVNIRAPSVISYHRIDMTEG